MCVCMRKCMCTCACTKTLDAVVGKSKPLSPSAESSNIKPSSSGVSRPPKQPKQWRIQRRTINLTSSIADLPSNPEPL